MLNTIRRNYEKLEIIVEKGGKGTPSIEQNKKYEIKNMGGLWKRSRSWNAYYSIVSLDLRK